MLCPRCEAQIPVERDRSGITVDIRQTCRGIWLDRGEPEKLIAREREESEAWERRKRDDDDDDDRRRKYKKRKSWLETLVDLID